jgi:hypothetical protein
MVFFPLLILFDMGWNKLYKCANLTGILISLIIGGGVGMLWVYIIDLLGIANLTYMTGGLSNETCQMASQTQFKCVLRQLA